jgi:glucosamine-6-phosphate deaminase
MGLGTIMESRALLLIATGEAKRAPLARAIDGPVDPACPASILQRHPRAIVVADKAAAPARR